MGETPIGDGMDKIPIGNGDYVRTRELYEVERRLGKRIEAAIARVMAECVNREADKTRHDAIGMRFEAVAEDVRAVEKSNRSLVFRVGVLVGSVAIMSNVVLALVK